jgi:hypothetical protein
MGGFSGLHLLQRDCTNGPVSGWSVANTFGLCVSSSPAAATAGLRLAHGAAVRDHMCDGIDRQHRALSLSFRPRARLCAARG